MTPTTLATGDTMPKPSTATPTDTADTAASLPPATPPRLGAPAQAVLAAACSPAFGPLFITTDQDLERRVAVARRLADEVWRQAGEAPLSDGTP